MTGTPSYEHTQTGIIRPILLVTAAAILVIMYAVHEQPLLVAVLAAAAGVFAFLSFAFAHLTVRDEGDRLAVRFGPIPLCSKTIPYAEMAGVERDRSSFLAGWGIHWTPTGRLWNIGGYDCVRIEMGRKSVRIGTDDADGLLAFLRAKISQSAKKNG